VIHIVYFSCKKHFKYLEMSVKSLQRLKSEHVGKIYVYADLEDFLSDEQIKSLGVEIRKTAEPMSWGGPKVIRNEIVAYREIAEECDGSDFIGKVDSDVLFIADRILNKVAESESSFVGETHKERELISYAIGSSYFFRANLAENFKFDQALCDRLKGVIQFGVCPEDFYVYHMISCITKEIQFTRINTHDLYAKVGSVMHFCHKRKNQMRLFYKLLIRNDDKI